MNEDLICKVSDFGLSRELESDASDGVYTTKVLYNNLIVCMCGWVYVCA